jgi:small-conductance mechanosensitive channel
MTIWRSTATSPGSMLVILSQSLGWSQAIPNANALVRMIWTINLVLLTLNLLPIYPLDGGQILRSLLWFVARRARSLLLVAVTGFLGVAGFMAMAWWKRSVWFAALAVLTLVHCWRGMKHARALWRLSKVPRQEGFACPCCKAEPPKGKFWRCEQCSHSFDTFQALAICPKCAERSAGNGSP